MPVFRAFWFAVGICALGLGVLGALLPLLPTTPFVLVAAFAFARSSQRWHDWLITHRVFGPLIEDWRAHGAISRPTKAVAALSIIVVFCISVALRASILILIIQGIVLTGSAIFILSRPSPPFKR